MSRGQNRRSEIQETQHIQKMENTDMKVVMTSMMCGPEGNADHGTVLEVSNERAKELIEGRFARAFDINSVADRKLKKQGLVKAEK